MYLEFPTSFLWMEAKSCNQHVINSLFKREKASLGLKITESYNARAGRVTCPCLLPQYLSIGQDIFGHKPNQPSEEISRQQLFEVFLEGQRGET